MTSVVVVGAGVVGAATAFHAARLGARVTVLDASRSPAGATALSAGFVRVHQDDPTLAEVAALGLAEFAGWERVVGSPSPFVRTGCAYLLPTGTPEPSALPAGAVLLDAAGLRRTVSVVRWRDDERAVWEPAAGWADPAATRAAYLAAAARAGAVLRPGEAVTAVGDGRVALASGGWVVGDAVVLATGAWAATRPAGMPDLPLRSRRILWQRCAAAGDLPCVVSEDPADRWYARSGPDGVRFGVGCDDWDVAVDGDRPPVAPDLVALGRARIGARLGLPASVLAASELLDGFDGYTPDGRPLVGELPGRPGTWVATGFSGGGFKSAPAFGRLVAERLVTGAADAVLDAFAPSRFARV